MGFLVDAVSSRFAADTSVMDPRFWQEAGWLRKTASGETVTPERALTLSAYFAAIRVISEDVAKLPIHIYRAKKPRGKEVLDDDPTAVLLRESPNPEMTAFTFRETLTQWAAGWGYGCAEKVFDNAGVLRELWPIHPSRVRPMRNAADRLIFRVRIEYDPGNPRPNNAPTFIDFEADEIFHLRGMGNATNGYSVAAFAAETLGVSLATQTFGAAFFANGTQGGGIISHPKTLSEPAQKNLRETWQTIYGSAKNGYSVKILEEGAQFTPTFVPPNEAQFIETREFQVEDICRWFRIAPHKIQHLKRSSFSNIEQQSIEHVTDTLMPWMVRWELEAKRQLIGRDRAGVFVSHNVNGLLRGDANARANFYRTMANLGAMSPNDIREYEDENPIPSPAGDQYYMQTNMSTLDRIDAGTANAQQRTSAPTVDDTVVDPTTDDQAEMRARADQVRSQALSMRPVLAAEADRVLRKEARAMSGAKAPVADAWVKNFYEEQAGYAVEAMSPGATALSEMTSKILGTATHPIDMTAWAAERMKRAVAVVLGSRSGGIAPPADHTPDIFAGEIVALVLRTYGIEP